MKFNFTKSTTIPKEKCLDNTYKLISEGYLFIPNRIRKYNSDIFQTRLIGQKVICLSGKDAAMKFYDQNLFTRKDAVPKRIQETLFGKNAIQTLDGAAHMDRKLLFMSMMTPDKINEIKALTKKQWQSNSRNWETKSSIVIFQEAERLFFQVACKWAGVPIKKSEIKQKSHDMSAMIDAFGAIGLRHWKGRNARNRTECWATQIIQNVRSDRIEAPENSALSAIAWHKDLSGNLLDKTMSAIELINVLRPITAIATYVTFGASALHTYPEFRNLIKSGDNEYLDMFAQEVRRFYPFGPFLGARVRNDFNWRTHSFKKGDLVFLDLFGTNHDPKIWNTPNEFSPDHFRGRISNPFDFIPQGGGDYKTGTRCPGEWLTVELLKTSLAYLARNLEYDVPLQDLSYKLNRIPTLPKSKFIITNVRTIQRQ